MFALHLFADSVFVNSVLLYFLNSRRLQTYNDAAHNSN